MIFDFVASSDNDQTLTKGVISMDERTVTMDRVSLDKKSLFSCKGGMFND